MGGQSRVDRCTQPFSRGLVVESMREVAGEFIGFVGRRLNFCAGVERKRTRLYIRERR